MMTKRILMLAAIFSGFLAAPAALAAGHPPPTDHTELLNTVIKTVQTALNDYQTKATANGQKDPLPPIASADFDFKTVNQWTEGLTLNLYIFTIGGSHQSQTTADTEFLYKPEKQGAAPHIANAQKS